MKPSVSLIHGTHITATDKRTILACITYLTETAAYGTWLRKGQSNKAYCITPDSTDPHRYAVMIKTTYRSDTGHRRTQTSRVVIDVKGIKPVSSKKTAPTHNAVLAGDDA